VLTVGNEQRLARIAEQLNGIEYELIYSETKEELGELNQQYAHRQLNFFTRKLSLGEMGAWRIHVRAWEKVTEQETACLIFEDNALIHSDLAEKLPQILADTRDYGMISFSEHTKRSTSATHSEITRWNVPLYMYGITPFYADSLLSRIDKLGYSFPVDSWLRRIKLSQVRIFSSSYKLASRTPRRVLGTFAQNNIPKKSYKITYLLHRIINKIKYRT